MILLCICIIYNINCSLLDIMSMYCFIVYVIRIIINVTLHFEFNLNIACDKGYTIYVQYIIYNNYNYYNK